MGGERQGCFRESVTSWVAVILPYPGASLESSRLRICYEPSEAIQAATIRESASPRSVCSADEYPMLVDWEGFAKDCLLNDSSS